MHWFNIQIRKIQDQQNSDFEGDLCANGYELNRT